MDELLLTLVSHNHSTLWPAQKRAVSRVLPLEAA